MKRTALIYAAAIAAAAFVSCSKEIIENEPSSPQEGPKAGEFLNPVTLTFTADPSTKISIDDKGVASWEEGDQIVIMSFDAEGTARKSEAVTVDASTGKFTATVESSDTYYAVYPASATVALAKVEDVDNLTVTIPATQNGTLKESIYYAAKTSATDRQFNFKTVSGIIKFEAAAGYTVAQIRNVENTSSTHAFNGAAACTFDGEGNLTVTPKPNYSSTHTINLDGSGTYYAAIVGNAANELTFRFSKDGGTTYEPGVFINKLVTFTPGHIKSCGKLTDKIYTDLYLSVDGTGDGLTAETPAPYSAFISSDCLGEASTGKTYVEGLGAYSGVWNCWRRDGVTVHLAAGEYTAGFNVKGTGSAFKMTVQGVIEGSDTTKIQGLCTFEPAAATHTTIKNLAFNSANGALIIRSGQWEINDCVFTKCSGTNTVVVGSTTSTDESLKANFRNCLFYKNTVPEYGAVKTAASSTGGIIGFHNCRFDSNVATAGNGAAIGSGSSSKLAIFLNKCTFIGNTHTTKTNGYTVYMNGVNTRLAMNCCTVNAGSTAYSKGASITTKGQSVISNSTVWSSKVLGKWGLLALGCTSSNNGALVINSVMRQKNEDYPAYYLHTNYYQHLSFCLHSAIDLTVIDGKHTVENTLKVSSFNSAVENTKVVDGITAGYYTWNYANTVGSSSFTKPSAETVRSAISATGETSDEAADGIGGTFLTWLDAIDANWLSKDLIGTDRPEAGLCPGSVEQAN